MTAFTIGFPIGIHRTLFFDIGNFEKQQEKSGFPSRNQKYVVYLILNNLWRLVCTGQMVRGTNFISGSPPPILLTGALQRSLNSVTLTGVRGARSHHNFKKMLITVGLAHAPGLFRFFVFMPSLVVPIVFHVYSFVHYKSFQVESDNICYC